MVGAPAGYSDVDALLRQMLMGDREAAAQFVVRYGSRIRRRIRGKLSPAMRRIFDSQDILSTVGRRLDQFVGSGQLEAATEQQLWALVFKIASNAVIDKSRIFRRLQKVEDEDGPLAQSLLRGLRQAERGAPEGIEIEQALALFADPIDREILALWLVGTPHTMIATYVKLAPTAVRKRWQAIRSRLQERFA